MKITTVGIDLAKNVFQVHGVNEFGKPGVTADQWDRRPHPKRHECAKVEVLINHLNRKGRPP